jgi:hypothetical protein
VLSFTTTHAITECLLLSDADAEATGWGGPPALLLLRGHTLGPTTHAQPHLLYVDTFPLPPAALRRHGGLPAALTGIAAVYRRPDSRHHRPTAGPLLRVLAWAVRYEDILADDLDLAQIRRVEAVDIDGRVYQITRLRGERHGLVLIDDQPDPDNLPATHTGLSALLHALGPSTAHY